LVGEVGAALRGGAPGRHRLPVRAPARIVPVCIAVALPFPVMPRRAAAHQPRPRWARMAG
jgi:hypothetical protein